jgi:hypothetical protein
MNEKSKKNIYFGIIILLAIAFTSLYLMDKDIHRSEGKDAFSSVMGSMEPAITDNQVASTSGDEEESYLNSDKVQVINWDKSKIDSIQIFSQRNNFTLIRHGERKWSLRSVRVEQKIVKTNHAIFRLTNMFDKFYTDNYQTRDYSELAEYYENPICTVIANFNDGKTEKMTFIRIEEFNTFSQKVKMTTWTRINEETVVYATTYNTLERFLISEKEFLKFY